MKEFVGYGLALVAIVIVLLIAGEEGGIFATDWFGRIFRFLK